MMTVYPSMSTEKLQAYITLMRLDRPIGIWLLLWPTLWALWIAGKGHPSVLLVFVFSAGVLLMRSAGCVINDYMDRQLDGRVARTSKRPLVTGQVSPREALVVFVVLCLLAASLLYVLPVLARWLAVPAVVVTLLYPYMKRITHLPQLVLGIAFSWGIPMAFAAQTGALPATCWYLFFITWIWVVAYDSIYAMADREDDLKAGIKSTAILWGGREIYVIAGLHIGMLLLLVLLGRYMAMGGLYYVSIGIAALVMCYQHFLIKDRIPARCFQAFLVSQWVGCAVFVGIYVG